ncbi:cell division protein FtsA [Ruminococcaceae bacterium OttesenSCG-928-D13]|nr:cell division protein FtsA [Ruminococcaceae bacterium OttesenSCG-928-D13]
MEQQSSPAGDGRIFVLDIGTRSVVGIAGHREGELFVVEAWAMEAHPRRAMIDGQIEDIEQVAKVAGLVKSRIEQQLGVTFTRVGVAAAGRALKTARSTAEADLPEGVTITPRDAYALENAAINAARLDLDSQDTAYYCVGHSVVRYLLDGYPFSTIVGHRGGKAEVEIIATFLPAEVVESLRRCMELLALEIDTLTLEPIAAMRAVIPQDLRLLNLALVDIGAGTSDIALSADGSVAGYTMATMAGDEVTEALIKKYLVDFPTAEQLKLGLAAGEAISYSDILGFEHTAEPAELAETIEPAVDTLAEVIAERIRDCNAGAPAAVFLVGGGSKTPGLCEKLEEKLSLPEKRVAAAGTQFSGKVLNEGSGLDGPEFATPVGIALTTADNAEVEGASVTINGQRVRLFTPATASVMDALLLGGYTYSDLMGRNGRPLTFALNGARTTVRGGLHTPAELLVNGKPASLATPVEKGDQIEITRAVRGTDASAEIADYARGALPLRVTLNGRTLLAGLIARVNGAIAEPDTPIKEQDAVELYLVLTVGELCEAAGIGTEGEAITVNGQPAGAATELHDGDVIICGAQAAAEAPPAEAPVQAPAGAATPEAADSTPEAATPMPAETEAETPPPASAPLPKPSAAQLEPLAESAPEPAPAPSAPSQAIEIEAKPEPIVPPEIAVQPAFAPAPEPKPEATPDPTPVPEPQPEAAPKPAPEPAPAPGRSLRVDLNGRTVVLPPKPSGEPHRLFDMLALVDIDPANPKGKVRVTVNGRDAPYLEELVSGDVVEIGWEEALS